MDRGLHDLSFRVWVDRQLTLRICPVIDGTSIIERFKCLRAVRGLEGLALGTRDASRYTDLAMGARVPLLSCDCGLRLQGGRRHHTRCEPRQLAQHDGLKDR